MTSGYTPCSCRTCFNIAISDDVTQPELCNRCEGVCDPGQAECSADDADDPTVGGPWVDYDDPRPHIEESD